MITTTLNTYPNHTVTKQLGIVTAYDDKLRMVRSLTELDTYLEHATQQLSQAAKKKGANAVLGVSLSMDDRVIPVLMGTAVVLEENHVGL